MNKANLLDTSRQRAAAISAWGLLAMAVLAPLALQFGFENLVLRDDASQTVININTSQHLLRGFILAFLVVAVLDLLVAWSLFIVFKPVDQNLSLLAAWLRLVYSALLAASVVPVLGVAQWVGGVDYLTGFSDEQTAIRVMESLQAFQNTWDIGLAVFGLHLVALGYVAARSSFLPRYVGILLGISGIGYLLDSLGKILSAEYAISIASFTFFGEVVLMVWLFIRAFKGYPERTVNSNSDKSLK